MITVLKEMNQKRNNSKQTFQNKLMIKKNKLILELDKEVRMKILSIKLQDHNQMQLILMPEIEMKMDL